MRLWISIQSQVVDLYDNSDLLIRRYSVSTALRGAGEQNGSFRTPRGRHIIRAKIGSGLAANSVLVRRRPTGEIWSPELSVAHPARDWILTRILWLSGTEPGSNRLGAVDTMRRYIYIHGSPDSVSMGAPGSIGCIRMTNRDIVELFDLVAPYTPVDIVEYGIEEHPWQQAAADAGAVREQVFVVEQGVPADMEYDDFDPQSRHAIARGPDGTAIGTGRLLPDGHIGRLAVLPAWRRHGVGRALMCHLTDAARRRGLDRLQLNAQISAAGFYERLGYRRQGEPFEEAGIAHIAMMRQLPLTADQATE